MGRENGEAALYNYLETKAGRSYTAYMCSPMHSL